MQITPKRRARWFSALVLVALIAAAIVFWPRGLGGPETVALEYFEALIQTPDDAQTLRAAGHLDPADDPQTLIDSLSTRIVLEFLRARERQGIAHKVRVATYRQPEPQRYVVVLEVTESGETSTAPTRRITISLQQTENGDWRVSAINAKD